MEWVHFHVETNLRLSGTVIETRPELRSTLLQMLREYRGRRASAPPLQVYEDREQVGESFVDEEPRHIRCNSITPESKEQAGESSSRARELRANPKRVGVEAVLGLVAAMVAGVEKDEIRRGGERELI